MRTKEEQKSDIMNLIGYGLAKFDQSFVSEFGMSSKSAFARYLVQIGLTNTTKAVSNRMDSFDPYFDNGRRGWYQRNQREHIKLYIDSILGSENVQGFANAVKIFIDEYDSTIELKIQSIAPIQKSRFKQLQETGKEAEFYFINNYTSIPLFTNGHIEDARLCGDGYDFQVAINNFFYLVEVKGVREDIGSIRMTQREYDKAVEYKDNYILIVVCNLARIPRFGIHANPAESIQFTSQIIQTTQTNYITNNIRW